MTKFKVGDKVRILDVNKIEFGSSKWKNGDVTEVTEVANDGNIYAKINHGQRVGGSFIITTDEFHAIEKVSEKPTKNQRITALESELSALKAEVEALKQAQSKAYTVGIELAKPTANEQRKAIIAEAKAFEGTLPRTESGRYLACGTYDCTVEYIVNPEKRTVVALLKGMTSGIVRYKGVAKCAPDDVFNADIGKAIALGRALGLDVSKFEQAAKPTEVVVGMVIESENGTVAGVVVESDEDNFSIGYAKRNVGAILDDTEAKY